MQTLEKTEEIEELQRQEIKRIIEALLFSASEPIPFKKLRAIITPYASISAKLLRQLIDELAQDYKDLRRAFKLEEIAKGFVLRTYPQYGSYIEHIQPAKNKEKLSQASLEVLSIIAFRQPITRAEIEAIRGVDCSSMLQTLQEKLLIEVVGKKEVPGRPSLYGVTKQFLIHFGLSNVKEIRGPEMAPKD